MKAFLIFTTLSIGFSLSAMNTGVPAVPLQAGKPLTGKLSGEEKRMLLDLRDAIQEYCDSCEDEIKRIPKLKNLVEKLHNNRFFIEVPLFNFFDGGSQATSMLIWISRTIQEKQQQLATIKDGPEQEELSTHVARWVLIQTLIITHARQHGIEIPKELDQSEYAYIADSSNGNKDISNADEKNYTSRYFLSSRTTKMLFFGGLATLGLLWYALKDHQKQDENTN